jgi:LuxR family maltose regulon positive regulatory protein
MDHRNEYETDQVRFASAKSARVGPLPAPERSSPSRAPSVATARLTPASDQRTVCRERLLDALDDTVQHPLTLVSAPAGSGKTTLLATWARRRADRTVAWLTLDARDNDRRRFWVDLIAALAHATGRRPAAFGALDPLPDGALERVLTATAEGHDAGASPIVIVLDDAQTVTSPAVLGDVDALLAQTGAGLRVVWSTRIDPALRLQRLRVAGDLGELRLPDLAFTLSETHGLLDDVTDELARADVERIWRVTHGWSAGLRIAALGLAEHRDPRDFVACFAGDQQRILDYLRAEIVGELPDRTASFVLRTAGVRVLTAPLADALTGAEDSARLLDDLVRRGLLVEHAEGSHGAFRYHPPFVEALRELQRQRIDSELPGLHRRAARWYADDGQPAEAIRHASLAAEWELAGGLLAEHWMTLGLEGHAAEIRALAGGFPPSIVHDDAEIALAVGGLALEDGDEEEADYFLDVAAGRAEQLPPDRRRRYEVHRAATTLYRGRPQADPRATIDAGRTALRNRWDRGMEPSLRARARLSVGVAQLWLGEIAGASADLEQASALAAEAGNAYLSVQALGWSAVVDAIEGRLVEAQRGADAAIGRSDRVEHPEVAPALAARAFVCWQWNQTDRAEHAIARARAVMGASGNRALRTWTALIDARLHAVRGEPATGLRLLRPTTAAHDGYRLPPMLADAVDCAAAALRLQLGELDRAAVLVRSLERTDRSLPLATASTVRLGLRDPEGALRATDRLLAADEILPLAEITGWVSRAVALDMLGDADGAEVALERALDLSEPRGYRRPLLEAGSRVGLLLRRLIRRGTAHRALVAELMVTFEGRAPASDAAVAPVSEPLSARELTVLRYMPTTLPYPEVASELFVSVNTIKTHVRHVYRKLDVDNRRDAVTRARALRLLGPGTR